MVMVNLQSLCAFNEPFQRSDGSASGAEDTGVINAAAPMMAAATVVWSTLLFTPQLRARMTALVRVRTAPPTSKAISFPREANTSDLRGPQYRAMLCF